MLSPKSQNPDPQPEPLSRASYIVSHHWDLRSTGLERDTAIAGRERDQREGWQNVPKSGDDFFVSRATKCREKGCGYGGVSQAPCVVDGRTEEMRGWTGWLAVRRATMRSSRSEEFSMAFMSPGSIPA